MEIFGGLIVYLIFVLGLIIILIRSHIKIFSSIVIALIFGQIIINIICPPQNIDPWCEVTSMTALYFTIQIVTPIIVVIYALYRAFGDKTESYVRRQNSKLF
jgi:hypothetical protein